MKFLYENQNIPQELVSFIKDNRTLHPYFESNFSGVRPKNYCGFLSISSESYFIVPKIATDDIQNMNIFIYMLVYAYDLNLKNEELMRGTSQEHKIFELFIRLFSDALLDEFKKGVFKQYITLRENLKVMRGKYIIEQNFTNFYHQNIYCEFDEFSMDNELNRFFLYAIRVFKRFSTYPNLHRCEAILDEVDRFIVDFKRLDIRFDRLNSRYQKSYEVAMMILQRLVPMTEKSSNKSFAFLFDMAEVFEKFVGRMHQEIDSSARIQVQQKFGDLQLKPDIIMTDRIIDTKYKLVSGRGDLSAQDKYQMFAYGVNFDIRDTVLLYPKHLVDVGKNLVLGEDGDMVRMKMRSLDLEMSCGYDEFIRQIRERIKKDYDA